MDTLYKYVTADRALTCIPEVGDGTLRATQPAALNDPFECALVVAGYHAQEDEDAMAQILTTINERTPVTAEDVREAKNQYGSLFLRQLFADRISTKFGIVSLAGDPLHPLMWSHYTVDGSGFVIGYDVTELDKLVGQEGCRRAVQYEEIPPLIQTPEILASQMSDLPALLSRKSQHWAYENEWRLIIGLDSTIGTGRVDQHSLPINLVRIPNDAVVSIHYTERTPTEAVDLIRGRLSDKNNRYRADNPTKLIMATIVYGYYEETAR